jgi:hypothetical protein
MRVEINQRKEECFVRYYEMEIRHGIAMIVLGKVDSSEEEEEEEEETVGLAFISVDDVTIKVLLWYFQLLHS